MHVIQSVTCKNQNTTYRSLSVTFLSQLLLFLFLPSPLEDWPTSSLIPEFSTLNFSSLSFFSSCSILFSILLNSGSMSSTDSSTLIKYPMFLMYSSKLNSTISSSSSSDISTTSTSVGVISATSSSVSSYGRGGMIPLAERQQKFGFLASISVYVPLKSKKVKPSTYI